MYANCGHPILLLGFDHFQQSQPLTSLLVLSYPPKHDEVLHYAYSCGFEYYTVIIIMESPAENFVSFATDRFLLIMLGVLTAFIVNLFFIPPRYETKFYQSMLKESRQFVTRIPRSLIA